MAIRNKGIAERHNALPRVSPTEEAPLFDICANCPFGTGFITRRMIKFGKSKRDIENHAVNRGAAKMNGATILEPGQRHIGKALGVKLRSFFDEEKARRRAG